MGAQVVVCGEAGDLAEASRLVSRRLPEVRLTAVERTWDLEARAREGGVAVAVLLAGPISEHDRRVESVVSLRREGFRGRVLYAGSFLTEKHDALAAGVDYVFAPDRQPVDAVVAQALFRPRVALDHPYLGHLLVGEWAELETYRETLPPKAPALLLATTSCHRDSAFWDDLASYAAAHGGSRCLVVEDDEDPEIHAMAMACGVQPYVPLREKGLLDLHDRVRRSLHETWLTRMMAI